jgi:hypothetical protein
MFGKNNPIIYEADEVLMMLYLKNRSVGNHQQKKNNKMSRRRDLDPRPADYKSAAQLG